MSVKLAMVALMLVAGLCEGLGEDRYYVQVIKATNEPEPPTKGAKAVGANLGEKLSPLRWKHYWEVERRDATAPAGKAMKVELNGDRTVELAPINAEKVEVRLYRGKQLARKSCHKPNGHLMAIFGGDEGERAWFVVVRREEPQYEVAKQ